MKEVTEIVGVKHARLRQWLEFGWLVPSIKVATGKGNRNIFSRHDLYKIASFKDITESGWFRESAGDMIELIDDEALSMFSLNNAGPEFFLAFIRFRIKTANSKKIICHPFESGNQEAKDYIFKALSDANDVYILNLGKIIDAVDSIIEKKYPNSLSGKIENIVCAKCGHLIEVTQCR